MSKRQMMKTAFAVGIGGLLLLPALAYTQVTGGVLNPRLRQSYLSLSAAVAAAAPGDTLLVSGTLNGANAILDSVALPAGLKIVAAQGLRGTLQVTSTQCGATTLGVILDVSARQGSLLIQGLKLIVPNGCIGIGSLANGNPLTVRNVLIQRATATANISGMSLWQEFGGPFLIEGNLIPSTGNTNSNVGIWIDGDATNPIDATVRRNRIGSTGAPTGLGIGIIEVPSGSSITVERNVVDGGNVIWSSGISVVNSNGVTIQQNTVRGFVGPTGPQNAFGILVTESSNIQVLRNVVANNDIGVVVCDASACGGSNGSGTAGTVAINFNNLTSTVTGAIGLFFFPDPGAPAPLDARNNWWGATSGPSDDDGDTTDCPEFVAPGCTTTPTAEGGGLPVGVNPPIATDDCDIAAGTVTTCPYRTSPVSPAGA
ncbi:MAG: hypothetical protein N2443_10685 [Blastocatellia bacterium]|nr:hypothetical protein [Blastocatellia bacterium]